MQDFFSLLHTVIDTCNVCVRDQLQVRYVLLRHSHRANKVQHYELLSLGGIAVFDEEMLPAGVRRAFKDASPSLMHWTADAGANDGQQREESKEGGAAGPSRVEDLRASMTHTIIDLT